MRVDGKMLKNIEEHVAFSLPGPIAYPAGPTVNLLADFGIVYHWPFSGEAKIAEVHFFAQRLAASLRLGLLVNGALLAEYVFPEPDKFYVDKSDIPLNKGDRIEFGLPVGTDGGHFSIGLMVRKF